MSSRIASPAFSLPGALDALQGLSKAVDEAAAQAAFPTRRWSW